MNYQTVRVSFNLDTSRRHTHSLYSYLVPSDWGVRLGDVLLVDSPRDGYATVRVHEVISEVTSQARVRAVCKVDDSEYLRYRENRAEIERINNAINARVTQLRNAITAENSSNDPQIAQLLSRLGRLS